MRWDRKRKTGPEGWRGAISKGSCRPCDSGFLCTACPMWPPPTWSSSLSSLPLRPPGSGEVRLPAGGQAAQPYPEKPTTPSRLQLPASHQPLRICLSPGCPLWFPTGHDLVLLTPLWSPSHSLSGSLAVLLEAHPHSRRSRGLGRGAWLTRPDSPPSPPRSSQVLPGPDSELAPAISQQPPVNTGWSELSGTTARS